MIKIGNYLSGGEIMEYLTARQAAEKWDLSPRTVQQLCVQGRISGALKFGKSWAIPADAEKPGDPRRVHQQENPASVQPAPNRVLEIGMLMPLMNTPFPPGRCRETAEAMAAGPQRDIALAEYHYFSGQPEQAALEAKSYLASSHMGLQLSACLIYTYANLSLGRIQQARFALEELNASLTAAGEQSPQLQAASAFAAAAGAVLLHLPLPRELPELQDFLPLLPPGPRAFALYVYAHYLYLQGEYGQSIGVVEATLSMGAAQYPIPAIYLHLVAVMDSMSLKQMERAKAHLLSAWELARPDDLIEGFGEHHGLLGGMLESVIKPGWPEDFRRIIDITYRFSAGWRRVHNPETGHDVADDLTTTEFAVCMLAARGWTNEEIGKHMNTSPNTVKRHLSSAMKKLGIDHRHDLKQYMLR
jgi:DNA-binding CsgD family transcriptional regulator